ncbi:VOC family protein [Priestia megaterium]|jgi:lactoylglutathione lyase|uniref:Glyoxalase/Bleomycin resistance /Dioxygenase superfamily protein n=1 Tax=Priestia megaterium (strain ATCC 14581 / DSM 32 / CCUG 1817 / JCM 2506 / NBRC 15308 / NCIMB 9376 / NCTC 10342 / NRRL B-14308 / VKM B-512 / Ford 19) TaxID=1348623 RepID=A0A0B6AWT1_PRIM2|nr:VOC family protein [Priestia megaterium]AJI25153.1 glyoxalase/Bleomycin resistance /Dioxygenase superfamily protein [Priestia megaterium NBRC 15308 = ATCC 14581]KFN05284.1 glyoxalase/Bleomycin resistance /Dioxygenase superfamily protein [Priestia megaterium]KGJ77275.1 glyoxalase [Priestia megaterium NBRC 15308 = ATCC 14581]MDH3186022.1 VOC family protein [Priestia megaterium]MDQ0806012.1 lactoylglutathione lyase [Priestia megaterium]
MIKKMEHTAIIVGNMDETIHYYGDMFGFKVRLQGSNEKREMAFLYLEEQPGMEIELIRDIDPIGEYNKSGIVNHLAFTVEDINKAIQHYKSKGIEFLSPEPQPTLEGGRMILFHGPNDELLQLVERVKL